MADELNQAQDMAPETPAPVVSEPPAPVEPPPAADTATPHDGALDQLP